MEPTTRLVGALQSGGRRTGMQSLGSGAERAGWLRQPSTAPVLRADSRRAPQLA